MDLYTAIHPLVRIIQGLLTGRIGVVYPRGRVSW